MHVQTLRSFISLIDEQSQSCYSWPSVTGQVLDVCQQTLMQQVAVYTFKHALKETEVKQKDVSKVMMSNCRICVEQLSVT